MSDNKFRFFEDNQFWYFSIPYMSDQMHGKLQGPKSDDRVFERYTGLKDKNRDGAEVYQGDIYKWCGLTFPITVDDYHGYRFTFGGDQLCRAFIEDGEYIGNIHEQECKP